MARFGTDRNDPPAPAIGWQQPDVPQPRPEPSPEPPPAAADSIQFGPEPHQFVDRGTAQRMLTALLEADPQQFGRLLIGALVGPEAVPAKRGRPTAG